MKNNIFLAAISACLILASCSSDSEEPIVVPGLVDCNGVEEGTSMLDDCGDCQQAYIYDVVTHNVQLLDDTTGATLNLGQTEILVMPNDSNFIFRLLKSWVKSEQHKYAILTLRQVLSAESKSSFDGNYKVMLKNQLI